MKNAEHINYLRIEKAIHFMRTHFKDQPNLEEIASAVSMSPFHFQRVFTQWAGVSPKKFLQFLSLDFAKKQLQQTDSSLLDVAYETGLSGTGRLHDLFIKIESMTPGEFKKKGEGLLIQHSSAQSPFGIVLIASTAKGVCHISFKDSRTKDEQILRERFPNANFKKGMDQHQKSAQLIFQKDWSQIDQIKLHLAGTPFQMKVWESLIKIPFSSLKTYGQLAKDLGQPNAARAVGTAIGRNPIAYLIPCHRVIQNNGHLGGYHWGENRKLALIGWEASQRSLQKSRSDGGD